MDKPVNILDKILFALKVSNDNIIVVNDKLDAILKMMTVEESEPNVSGAEAK